MGRMERGCERETTDRSPHSPSPPTNQARTAAPVQNTTHTHITYVSVDYDTVTRHVHKKRQRGWRGPQAGWCLHSPFGTPPPQAPNKAPSLLVRRPAPIHPSPHPAAACQRRWRPLRRRRQDTQKKTQGQARPARATDGASPTGGGRFRTFVFLLLLLVHSQATTAWTGTAPLLLSCPSPTYPGLGVFDIGRAGV